MPQIRAYTVKHSEGEKLSSFIDDYRNLLQETINEVWKRTTFTGSTS